MQRVWLCAVLISVGSFVGAMDNKNNENREDNILYLKDSVAIQTKYSNFAVIFIATLDERETEDTIIRTVTIDSKAAFNEPYPEIEKFKTTIKERISGVAMSISKHFSLEEKCLKKITQLINSIVENDMIDSLSKQRQEDVKKK